MTSVYQTFPNFIIQENFGEDLSSFISFPLVKNDFIFETIDILPLVFFFINYFKVKGNANEIPMNIISKDNVKISVIPIDIDFLFEQLNVLEKFTIRNEKSKNERLSNLFNYIRLIKNSVFEINESGINFENLRLLINQCLLYIN